MVGEGVEYIFTDTRHTNPLYRVTPRDFIKEGQRFDYDKDKYSEMLEAAETVLGCFGFVVPEIAGHGRRYDRPIITVTSTLPLLRRLFDVY